MDSTAQEAVVTEDTALSNEFENACLQQDNAEVPALNFNLERKNSHGEDMPSLDNPHIISTEVSDVTNSELKEELVKTESIQNTTEVTETIESVGNTAEVTENTNATTLDVIENSEISHTELTVSSETPNMDLTDPSADSHIELFMNPENPNTELINTTTELTNTTETPSIELADSSEIQSSELPEPENSQTLELQEREAEEASETNNVTLENIKTICEVEEFPENNTVQLESLTEQEVTVENISGDQNTLESVMEAENAVAQIITPDEPQIDDEVETHILVQNDIDFPSEEQEVNNCVEVPNTAEETSISNVEYDVVLNDNQTDGISMNGVHGITKEEMSLQDGLYETQTVIKVDQDSSFGSETMGDIVTIASEVQNADGTIITLPSDTVTEVTFRNVEMLESHEGLVTINELHEQSEQQVVILPEDQMILMEAEDYDQPESIEVNVLESERSNEEELAIEEAEENEKEQKQTTNIPCHVLGRSVDNPLVDPVRNGRVLLKPRLGVKIPYRNLTSQIVSKQEIAEEIMERSRLRQSSAEPPAGGDVFFAKKLTQRLAKKLVPPNKSSKSSSKTSASTSSSSSSSNKKVSGESNPKLSSKVISKPEIMVAPSKVVESPKVVESLKVVESSKSQASSVAKSSPKVSSSKTTEKPTKILDTSEKKIIDNNDLIALLEGDDVPDWNIGLKSDVGTSTPSKTDSQKHSSDWERETALKQLKELPKQSKGSSKNSSNKYISSAPPQNASKETPQDKSEAKEIMTKADVEDEKDDLNIEPRFSSTAVVKTYTRKRKPYVEEFKPTSSASAQPAKKAAIASEEKPPATQKQPPPLLSPLKPSSPSVHKHPPVLSAQKSPSTVKSSPTPTVQKSSVTPKSPATSTIQKSSSSSNIQKSSLVTQKPSSSPSVQKQPSTSVAEKTPVVQKTPSSAKKPPVEEKKIKHPVQEKKQATQEKKQTTQEKKVVQEKRRPSTPTETQTPTPSSQPKKTLSPNTYISKSSRIVKRKKIWDPDEATPASKVTIKSPKLLESPEKPTPSPKVKPVAVLKPSNEKLPAKVEKPETPVQKPKLGRPVTVHKPSGDKPILKKVKKTIVKKKKLKRLTEVDRLLMDEGAVNLLYSVKNTEELQGGMKRKKKMKTLISLDRAQRELQNKTNEIKNDLQISTTKDSPISLRKKEGSTPKTSPVKDLAATILHRKKSKDSMSGSVHSPPASPGFAYAQHAEASRIIRRHSSSSFSSDESTDDEEEEENQLNTEKTTEKKHKAEPQKKKSKLNHEKSVKGLIGIDKQLLNEEMAKNFNRTPSDDPKYSKFETFNLRKFDKLMQIILIPTSANGQTTLSIQVLTELADVLGVLQKDDTCRVIVLSSSGNSFCQGIDYSELASDDKNKRQSVAENFAAAVRGFLAALSKFSKLLVAGVHGNTVGLGVTMLPLFDMVLASDTATFSTPYARLGCAAEGGVLLTLPHVMHNALASELFFASRKLTAAEALRLGLVTRTLWPDKFQEELISALKAIACQSLQSMQAIKKQLRHHLLLNVEASLKSESSTLIQHWTSNECQSNFSSYNLEIK